MTESEAIKNTLKIVKEWNEQDTHYEAPYLGEDDMAIIEEVLEKQVAKKVKVEWKDKKIKMTFFSCPVCQEIIGYIANTGTDSSGEKYCCYCGQRIDWSDEGEID